MRPDDATERLNPPPSRFQRTSAHTLELRESSGRVATLFGLPFFVGGILTALSLADALKPKLTPEGEWTPVLLGLMSLVFLVLGGVMLFGRRWLTLDLRRGTLTRRQGLLIPMHSEERHLNEFSAVIIAFDRGDSESPERYPVRLRAVAGKDFVITTPQKFSDSRKQAEYLSRFLHLPLADTITDHEAVSSPERVGNALRERLRSGELTPGERPTPPPKPFCEVCETAREATIIIRGPRFLMMEVLLALLPLLALLILIVIYPFRVRNRSAPGVHADLVIGALIFGLPFIAGSVTLMLGARSRKGTRVKASREGLVIERRRLWRTDIKQVSAEDILDLDYATFEGELKSARNSSHIQAFPRANTMPFSSTLSKLVPNKGIVVKSRQEIITFGEGLPANELQYLKWVLRKALAVP